MPPREARGGGTSRPYRSSFNKSDNTDEQQNKPHYRGNYRGNNRAARTEENNDTNTQQSNYQKGGYNTQRGTYRPRNTEEDSTVGGLPKTRAKPYKPGFIKKQKSETLPDFQVVARNEEEANAYTTNRTKKQPFKKPNPKDLVWVRPADRNEGEPPKERKQTFKPNPKDLVWERPADKPYGKDSHRGKNNSDGKKSTFTNFKIVASSNDEDEDQVDNRDTKRQPFKKPNPKDLVWERPADRNDSEQAPKETFKKQFKKPNPKDLVWERPVDKDDENQMDRGTKKKQLFKKPNPKDLIWERPADRDDNEQAFRNHEKEANAYTTNRTKKQPFKKPNPKDLVWERPADRNDSEQAPKETFKKQFTKPNPTDLVWERYAEGNDNEEQVEQSQIPTGIHKYLDDLSQGPNIFTLPQGFSGFGSYRESSSIANNLFEVSKQIIVNTNEDDEEDNIIQSVHTEQKEESFQDQYEENNNHEELDEDEEDNNNQDDIDNQDFVIERNSPSYDEKDSEKILPIPSTILEKENNNKNIIYSKLKTIEAKTKIWEKNYPLKPNSIIGTCQDKCPKQEIINREKDNDLSVFEKTGKIIIDEHGIKLHKADPNACVKKYARSAAAVHADPSLIRPPMVLKKTLEYLTNNILERKEEYHTIYFFVRDRARSIIQDLTIQDIRDERSVDLHEIISRFHIMSHHLLADVGEELSDPHQNLELMSKWLKSLQELYLELRLNGIECPNESEFTAYYILVKITSDQEVAKCLRNLPPHVSKSPEVLFALKVYGAFSTKNYVRYFELVKQASYLNACLMHMYFAYIREEALNIMNTAFYTKPTDISKAGKYPLSKLIEILAFETKGECIDFCKAHGIYVDGDDVLFKYSTFVKPKKIKSKRSFKVIEAKVVGVRYSEIVNLNFRLAPETTKTPPKELETIEPPKTSSIITNPTREQSIPPANDIIPSEFKPSIPPTVINVPPKTETTNPPKELPQVVINQPSTPILLHREITRPVGPPTTFNPNQIPPLFTINSQPKPPIPPIQPQIILPPQQPQPLVKIPKFIPVQETFIQIPVSPIKPLGPTEEEVKNQLKSKYFSLLRKNVERKKKLRESRNHHINNAMDFVLQENTMAYDNEEESMCTYYKHMFKKRYLRQLYQPLDLASLIFNSSVTDRIDIFGSFFWKLMIVPGTNSTNLNEWIESKFSYPNCDDYLCNFVVNGKAVDSLPRLKKNAELHICVRTPKDSRSWRGTSSIIFILDNPNNTDLQVYFSREKKRLRQHFSNLESFNNVQIPILILFDKSWFHSISENILEETFLQAISENFKYFSHVEYIGINFAYVLNAPSLEETAILNQIIENYTLWLANSSSGAPLIHTYSIRDLIEETTFSHIRKLLSDIDLTIRNGITVKDLILVYNDICESLSTQTIAETERMRKLNWPAPEFEKYCDWNTDENSMLQKELLGQLSLPTIDLTPYNSKHILESLFSSCKQYVATLYSKRKIYNPSISSLSIKNMVADLVNGGGYASCIKIFEMFLEIHLTLLFDKDPLYSNVFTTEEFKNIVNSVLERLRFSSNPFMVASLRVFPNSTITTTKNTEKTKAESFRNLKRISKESTQDENQDYKKRKVLSYIDMNQYLGMHAQLSNKISEQKNLFSHLESAPTNLNYQLVDDAYMSDTVSNNNYQSCIDSLKLLQEKLEMCRKGI